MIRKCAIDRVCALDVQVQESLPRQGTAVLKVQYKAGISGQGTPTAFVEGVATSERVMRRAQALVDAIADDVEAAFDTGKPYRGKDIGGVSLD